MRRRRRSRALGAENQVEAALAGTREGCLSRRSAGWAIPAGHDASETAAIRPREPRLYAVTGFVRKIKLSDDDCDLHLELADSGAPGAPRVIVEIPAAQSALQKKAVGMFNLSEDVQSHVYNDDKVKRITVTGYAFLDLSHQCAAFPKAGCQRGSDRVRTLWEIHPVLTLAWAK
jgi:hypothetical protein